MRKPRQKSTEIRDFIIENVNDHPKDVARLALENFGISRPAVLGHINKLVDEGLLTAHGRTRDRRYELNPLVEETFRFKISPESEEDAIWRLIVQPNMRGLSDNVLRICEYGMNEMLNNAIEHSEGTEGEVQVKRTAARIELGVLDNGIGIFDKIRRDLNLTELRQAILELAKGKLTTDPDHHTGEGIFFTSRMFDDFVILSGELFFSHQAPGEDWLSEHEQPMGGTSVLMSIHPNSDRKIGEVFDAYTSNDFEFSFTKTHVPVSLGRYGDENLISRSQARRILSRFDRFEEIVLDFTDIDAIGRAFADEIFRVFARNYPQIKIMAINTSQQIDKMINRVRDQG